MAGTCIRCIVSLSMKSEIGSNDWKGCSRKCFNFYWSRNLLRLFSIYFGKKRFHQLGFPTGCWHHQAGPLAAPLFLQEVVGKKGARRPKFSYQSLNIEVSQNELLRLHLQGVSVFGSPYFIHCLLSFLNLIAMKKICICIMRDASCPWKHAQNPWITV